MRWWVYLPGALTAVLWARVSRRVAAGLALMLGVYAAAVFVMFLWSRGQR